MHLIFWLDHVLWRCWCHYSAILVVKLVCTWVWARTWALCALYDAASQGECINTQPQGRQLVTHRKSTAVPAHPRALQRVTGRVRERKRMSEEEEGHGVPYLTRRLLHPVAWYNLKGDAASHLPLCRDMHSRNNDGSHFYIVICHQHQKDFTSY